MVVVGQSRLRSCPRLSNANTLCRLILQNPVWLQLLELQQPESLCHGTAKHSVPDAAKPAAKHQAPLCWQPCVLVQQFTSQARNPTPSTKHTVHCFMLLADAFGFHMPCCAGCLHQHRHQISMGLHFVKTGKNLDALCKRAQSTWNQLYQQAFIFAHMTPSSFLHATMLLTAWRLLKVFHKYS